MALALGLASQSPAASLATGEGQFFRGGLSGSTGVAGGIVAMPNGKYSEYTEDLLVKVPGGHVRWVRDFNGNQWRFNPQWASLEFEFDEILLGSSSSGAGAGGATLAVPTTPPEVFGGTRIPGRSGGLGPEGRGGPLWAISRNGAWFTVDASYCNFVIQNTARYLLKPVFNGEAPACPTNRFAGMPSRSGGSTGETAAIRQDNGGMPANLAGFRWEDRGGDWIEFERSGRIHSYGDRNNVKVSFQYTGGRMTGVVDHNGRLVMSIGYDGNGRIGDVRDVPGPGDTQAARIVRYTYDGAGSIATVTDVRGHVTHYGYDGKDRLTSVTDAEQRVRHLAYGPTNRVVKLTQPDGAAIDYDYDYDKLKKQFLARTTYPELDGQRRVEVSLFDPDGQLISEEVNNRVQRTLVQEGRTDRITDAHGNVTQVQRNEHNQITSFRHADGVTLTNQFDAHTLNLLQQRDRNGGTHRYEYDDAGNLRRRILAAGTPDERITEYVRDERQRVRTITAKGRTESNGMVTLDATAVYDYDDQDNVVAVTDPEGKISRFTHNRLGQVLTATEPLGAVWRYSYDNDGNLLSTQSPLGFTTRYDYDKVANGVKLTDARGKVWRSRFDSRNREIASIDPGGAEYLTEYSAIGTTSAVTDASGTTMRFEYDAWTRPAKARDGKGQSYQFDYTEADGSDTGARRPNKMKYPTHERVFKYDSRHRVSQVTDLDSTSGTPDGYTEQYGYDGEGRRKTTTDANGKTRTIDYNAYGQMVRMADSMGNGLRMLHDARGNVIEITDPNGRKTRFAYDLRDLITSETDPLGKTTRYTWDDNGWPVQTLLANGNKVEFGHDTDGRLVTQKEYTPKDGAHLLVKTTTFSYDADDNLLGWSDGRYGAAMVYDDAGRLSGETLDYGSFTKSRSYTYYPNNQAKTYTGPDGVTIRYSYDAQGQLERVSIPGEGDITVTDWQWAARKNVLLPGGTQQRFEYDGLLMMTKFTVVSPAQATVFELENKYGRLQEVTQAKRDGATTRYSYDDAYRLTGVLAQDPQQSAAFSEGFTVDAMGNRVSHTRTGGAVWQYDEAHQLKQRGSINYEYDDNGNLVKKIDASLAEPQRTTSYAYDVMNRLSELRDGTGALIASYSYDPFDRRLSKQLGHDGPTTYYMPLPTGLLAELDASGQVQVSYGWHPAQEDSMYPLYARIPEAAAEAPNDGAPGQRYVYYHNDQLGTPYRITDKAGQVVWAAQYDAFGKATLLALAGPAISNALRFPGQYFDDESGLHYNNRRFYDPDTGRYLTRDPIGFAGGVNLYAYAAHSPTNFVDPSGEVLPALGWYALRFLGRMAGKYVACVASCLGFSTFFDVASTVWNGVCLECNNIKFQGDIKINWEENAKDCAIDCLWSLIPIPDLCGKFGTWVGIGVGVASAVVEHFNSFPGETLVHVRPQGATQGDARGGKAVLKPISEVRPGEEVLALSEWKERGADPQADARLGYERVTDVFTSQREQTLVHITLDSGEVITATEGHPFKTGEGWRDAILLKRGGQLLLKGPAGLASVSDGSGEGGPERSAGIADLRIETKTVQVFNLEVANAHTFYVGVGGIVVHNAKGGAKRGPVGDPNTIYNVPTRKAAEDMARSMGGIERIDKPHGPGQRPHIHVKDKPGRPHIHICYPKRFGW